MRYASAELTPAPVCEHAAPEQMPGATAEALRAELDEQCVTITRKEYENLKRQIAELSVQPKAEGVAL